MSQPGSASSHFRGHSLTIRQLPSAARRQSAACTCSTVTGERLRLDNLSPQEGSRHRKRRIGRGYGAGQVTRLILSRDLSLCSHINHKQHGLLLITGLIRQLLNASNQKLCSLCFSTILRRASQALSLSHTMGNVLPCCHQWRACQSLREIPLPKQNNKKRNKQNRLPESVDLG